MNMKGQAAACSDGDNHRPPCFEQLADSSILTAITLSRPCMKEEEEEGRAGATCSLRATSSSKALVRGDRLAFLKPLEGLGFGPNRSALKSFPCTPKVSNLHTPSDVMRSGVRGFSLAAPHP